MRFLDDASLFDLVGLADFLEEELKIKVDIVPIDTIRKEIKRRCLERGCLYMRDTKIYLQDILEAMEAIEKFVIDFDLEGLKNSDMVSSAVIRKFEVIGEATKNIPEDITKKYPEVSWKKMAGMRDRLIHFYFGIKYDLVAHYKRGNSPYKASNSEHLK